VLVGAERARPYERPHLSKGFLAGTVSLDALCLRPIMQYRQLRVDLQLGDPVLGLGLEERRLLLESGKTLGWDLMCIATGSDARRLDAFKSSVYLRELQAARRLRALIQSRRPMDIVGAGFIGCEVAAVARQSGSEVRVHEVLAQPLLRVLGPELGAYLAAVHRDHGVEMRLGAQPPRAADVVAVGSIPRASIAELAGMSVDGGIVVDEWGRTSAPDVYAAGDVTRFFHPLYETFIRVEHFQTAQRQGFAVGRVMAGGMAAYDEVPWFWSDQYDLNLQYVGAGFPWDEIVVRGELGRPPFTVFYMSGDRLVAAAGINDHHTVARARRLMQERGEVTRSQLQDPSFDLRSALV
jgi:3-phenylpropionate/trans-cinnamate dioxygenase ferredoxin reductase subunit